MDAIYFESEVLDVYEEPIEGWSPDNCYICGLHLEGARWDPKERVLAESNPKELYTKLPIVSSTSTNIT